MSNTHGSPILSVHHSVLLRRVPAKPLLKAGDIRPLVHVSTRSQSNQITRLLCVVFCPCGKKILIVSVGLFCRFVYEYVPTKSFLMDISNLVHVSAMYPIWRYLHDQPTDRISPPFPVVSISPLLCAHMSTRSRLTISARSPPVPAAPHTTSGGTPPWGRKLRPLGQERLGIRVSRSPFPDAAYAAGVLEKRQLRGVTATARDSLGAGWHSDHFFLPPFPSLPLPKPPCLGSPVPLYFFQRATCSCRGE